MAETYTIADLCAMDNSALDKMAAELRGYTEVLKMGTYAFWQDANGKKITESYKWKPTTNCNQSRDLLAWASTPFDGAVTKEPILFDITFGRFDRNKRLPMIEVYQPEFAERGYDKRVEWTGGNKWIVTIPGNDARAEVTAYCAAMLARAGRLKGE